MNPRTMVILPLLFAGVALGQGNAPPSENSAVAAIVGSAGGRIVWSKEVGQLRSGETRAVFTALTVANSGRQARGVRVDSSWTGARGDTYYIDERFLLAEKEIFDQLARDVAMMQAKHLLEAGTGLSILGSCEFRDAAQPYPLVADYAYSGPGTPALRITTHQVLLFPELTPADLAKVLGSAIDAVAQ
jgi:hypothetical protein